MNDLADPLTCPICFETYTAIATPQDRRPINFCKNGHTLCSTCASGLNICPTCSESKMLVPNRALLDVVERQLQCLTLNNAGVPEIPPDHVSIAARPFAGGRSADVYDATWQSQSVAVKVLRRHVVAACQAQDLLREARLAMSLNHPNVVRVYGVVSIDDGKGILMEKASRGSLRLALCATSKLSLNQLFLVSIDIVDGLDFIHSNKMIHRDLKPENVLLFDVKSQLTAKIADFGTSKVIQSSLSGTTMIGTPYYMAPEQFKTQVQYGSKVDVYSLAVILYEVFSNRNIRVAYAGIENMMQLINAISSGRRPKMPESFPAELRTVIERGWSADTTVRPTLADYKGVLSRLKTRTRDANPVASASTSGSADAYAIFERKLHELVQSTKAYKLNDARSQVEACRNLWTNLRDRTTVTASTVQLHSLEGYVHGWFGKCSVAYAETYQALTELYELCVLGTNVEGEQVVTVLRYAVEVCCSQNQYAAAIVLFSYAVRYAKSNLSEAAYADVLECFFFFISSLYLERFSYFRLYDEKWAKIAEFVLLTRLKASPNKSHINVAAAHCYLAHKLLFANFYSDEEYSAALDHLEKAQHVIIRVDAGNIWAAVCKCLEGRINNNTSNEEKLKDAKKCFEDALQIAKRILGEKGNPTISLIYVRFAITLKEMKLFKDAESAYKKAIKAAEISLGPNSCLASFAMECLANMYLYQMGRYEEAETLYLRSIKIRERVFGAGFWKLSYLYESLARICTNCRRIDKAATYVQMKSEVDSGKLEDKFKSTEVALHELVDEVSRSLESGNGVMKTPGELVGVLNNFFKVAPKP